MYFRPWGKIPNLLPKYNKREWCFIGAIGTEERSLAAFFSFSSYQTVTSSHFFSIIDPRDTEAHQNLRNKHILSLRQANPLKYEIYDIPLLDMYLLDKLVCEILETDKNFVIDISVMPKRFFFFIIKMLYSADIDNLFVLHTLPDGYTEGQLSQEPYDLNNLPGFMHEGLHNITDLTAVLSVGFMQFMLPEILKDTVTTDSIFVLFPFPTVNPNYQRTWNSLRRFNNEIEINSRSIYRTDPSNPTPAFNRLNSIYFSQDYRDENGMSKPLRLFPYGPKPISLAMCLFALKTKSAVYYTQPAYYAPDYSHGYSDVYCFVVIQSGLSLYELFDNENGFHF